MDLTPEEAGFINQKLPDGVVPVGFVSVIYYLSPEGEPLTQAYMNIDEIGVCTALGMAEMLKQDIMAKYRCGPWDPWNKQHDGPPEDDDD